MQKKLFSFLAFLLIGAVAFAGCNLSQRDNSVTISLSGWQTNPNEQQLLRQVLNNFEAKHPKIKVKYAVINDQYMDVIKTRLIGDTAPDVFYLDAFEAPALMKYGVLENLDTYITTDFELTDFVPQMLKAFQWNGKTYGLPKDFSTLALFYNKKAFAAVGLLEPPKTWEEMREYSQKLTIDRDKDGRIDQYGLGVDPELARQVFMIQAFGGKLIDKYGNAAFASPEGLQGLQLVVNQYQQDKSSAQPSDVGATSGSEMFGQEKVAMVIEGPWLFPFLKQTFPNVEYATAEVPTVNGKKGTMAYTVAYVMNKQCRNKRAAWELISYLTSKEGMKAWTKQGIALPSRKSVTAALGYDKNSLYSPFIAGATYATIWQSGENLPTIFTNFNNQFISAMLGEQTLVEAMEKAQATANREIALAQ